MRREMGRRSTMNSFVYIDLVQYTQIMDDPVTSLRFDLMDISKSKNCLSHSIRVR